MPLSKKSGANWWGRMFEMIVFYFFCPFVASCTCLLLSIHMITNNADSCHSSEEIRRKNQVDTHARRPRNNNKRIRLRHLVFLHSLSLWLSALCDFLIHHEIFMFHIILLYILVRRSTVKSHNIEAHKRSCRHIFSVFLPFLASKESSSRRSWESSRLILLVNIKLHMSVLCVAAMPSVRVYVWKYWKMFLFHRKRNVRDWIFFFPSLGKSWQWRQIHSNSISRSFNVQTNSPKRLINVMVASVY